MNKGGVTGIIFSTYNNGETAVKCMKSCLEQERGSVVVVAADDGSTDQTVSLLKEAAAGDARFLLLELEHGERGAARVAAIDGARAQGIDYLFFIDSDMILEKDLVVKCTEYLGANGNVGALVIPEIPYSEFNNFFSRVKVFERSVLNNAGTELGKNSIEAARFWRMEAYDSTGGMNPSQVSFEETQPTIRYTEQGGLIKRAVFTGVRHNEKKVTLSNLLGKKRYYFSMMNRTLSTESRGGAKALQRWYFFRPVLYRRDNLKSYVRHPLLTAGMILMYFALTAVGVWEIGKSLIKTRQER